MRTIEAARGRRNRENKMSAHMFTTLSQIRATAPWWDPLDSGEFTVSSLPKNCGEDHPISLEEIVANAPLQSALWALPAFPQLAPSVRRFADACLSRVRHLLQRGLTVDPDLYRMRARWDGIWQAENVWRHTLRDACNVAATSAAAAAAGAFALRAGNAASLADYAEAIKSAAHAIAWEAVGGEARKKLRELGVHLARSEAWPEAEAAAWQASGAGRHADSWNEYVRARNAGEEPSAAMSDAADAARASIDAAWERAYRSEEAWQRARLRALLKTTPIAARVGRMSMPP